MDNISTIIIVGANLATILAVVISAFKISVEFGGLKKQVEVNTSDITRNEDRIHKIEGII